jgi:hypothetical protein
MDSQGRSGDGKCGEEKTPAHATNSTLSSKERATTERREEKDGGGGEDKGRKESRRRGEEEEEHGRQTFPARALEQRAARLASGWGSSGDDPHACSFLAPVGPISARQVQAPMQGQQAAQRRSPYRHRRLVELYLTSFPRVNPL